MNTLGSEETLWPNFIYSKLITSEKLSSLEIEPDGSSCISTLAENSSIVEDISKEEEPIVSDFF